MSQTMLYKPGSMLRVWHKYDVDIIKVPDAEIEECIAEGWHLRPGDWEAKSDDPASGALLDSAAKVIEEALPSKSLEELEALLTEEEAGKARKGVVKAIQAEIDKRLSA